MLQAFAFIPTMQMNNYGIIACNRPGHELFTTTTDYPHMHA